jgi:hypothetical protein
LAEALRRHESEDAMTQLRPTMQNGPLTSGGGAWAGWTMFAIAMACLSILIQIVFLAVQPFWSVLVIALVVAVILALTAHWDEAKI